MGQRCCGRVAKTAVAPAPAHTAVPDPAHPTTNGHFTRVAKPKEKLPKVPFSRKPPSQTEGKRFPCCKNMS